MKIYDISLKSLLLRLRRIARKKFGQKARVRRRGRHGTPLYMRITVIAYMVLTGASLIRMERSLKESPELRKILDLKWPVSKTTLSRWRISLGPLVQELIRYTYETIARIKSVPRSIAIIDTTDLRGVGLAATMRIGSAERRRGTLKLSLSTTQILTPYATLA